MSDLTPLTPVDVEFTTLTGKQLQIIERAVRAPMTQWETELISDVELAAGCRSAIEGRPVEDYLDYNALDLINSVNVIRRKDDDPGNASGASKPTPSPD